MKYEHRYSDQARQVLREAQDEAAGLGHDYVGTEHILMALIRDGDGPASEVLRKANVDADLMRRDVKRSVRRGRASVEMVKAELPYTSRSKKSLEYALGEARARGEEVSPVHLLIGLLLEAKGIAAQVLRNRGLDEDLVRELAFDGASSAAGSGSVRAAGPALGITIDDSSMASIREQIATQVGEAVATGRLSPGDRLPPVRRLADELDIAPGTVARAYGELERLGVVVTDGARGTRVADRERSALRATDRVETLVGLLRPVVVAAFHLGATAAEVRASLEPAMTGIFPAAGEENA